MSILTFVLRVHVSHIYLLRRKEKTGARSRVEGWVGYKIMKKCQFIKVNLKTWNKEIFGRLSEAKMKILHEIKRTDKLEEERHLGERLEIYSKVSFKKFKKLVGEKHQD